jgi:hypothetical protein
MKSKMIPLFVLAALMLLLQPAWAGPYTSKSQTATPSSDNTAKIEPATAAPKKCPRKFAKAGKKHPRAKMAMKHGGMKRMMANMSESDRTRFQSIREKMRSNPDVQAAREAVKSAEGRDAKRAAFKKLSEVRRAAMSDEDRAFMDGLKGKMKDRKGGKKCRTCDNG